MKPTVTLIPERPPVPASKRGKLTKYEFAVLFLEQAGRCGCGCGQRLEPGQVDEEHSPPVEQGGPEKPNALYRRDCHRAKTKADARAIAKARRLRGETGRHSGRNVKKIQSRGFQKDVTRGFDGKVRKK